MSNKSKFTSSKKKLSRVEKQFEKWLLGNGYSRASDYYPGGVAAMDLIGDFLSENPNLTKDDKEELEEHAILIGHVSDYDVDDIDQYDPDTYWN